MPSNIIETEEDEKKWERAKEQAEEEGKGDNYGYIVSIYKNMNPDGIDNNGGDEKEGSLGTLAQEIVDEAVEEHRQKTASNETPEEESTASKTASLLRSFADQVRSQGIDQSSETSISEFKRYIDALS